MLGPVQVHGDDGPVRLGGKVRTVLGTLLLHLGTSVSRDRLIAAVWDRPPASAVANLQTYVSQLRRALAGVATLRTQGSRYLLPLERDQLDLSIFDDAVRRARGEAARGDLPAADREFGRAFSLCRGRPFEDAWFGSVMTPRVSGVEERLAHARADWIDVRLDLGRHDDLLGELLEIVHAHPTWERAWNWYMLALYRAGRRTDALDAYHRARAALAGEMGIDPGPELTRLHASILRGDPATYATPPREEAGGWPAIHQLPPDIGDFVGRGEELESLAGTILAGHTGAPVIAAVHGTPGVGKSALAVHLAHRLRPHFPDGQLYVRLTGNARTPGELLAGLLRVLRVPETAIPESWEDRAALYRSRLADRSVLLLLDDASDEEQVRALLPGTPGSAVLVTSRRLLLLEGTAVLALAVPPPDQALELLARAAGEGRLRRDPDAAAAVVRACGRLPLALRVAGARLAARPAWPIRDLADRLEDPARRLDELSSGRLGVRASFEGSYAALPPAARRAFRLLGLTGFRRTAGWTVAALLGEREKHADALIETLVMAGLLVPVDAHGGRPRYATHELLRVYARERAHAEDDARSRRAALRALITECLERTRAAVAHLPPPFAPPPPGGPLLRARDREWPGVERDNLIAAVALAAELGRPGTAAELAYHLTSYLTAHGLHDDVARVQRTLLTAGEPREAMRARLILAEADLHRGRFQSASAQFDTLLDHFERAGDRHASAYARTGRGICARILGRRREALDDLGRAAGLFRELGDGGGALHALLALAKAHLDDGRYEDVVRVCRSGLELTGGGGNDAGRSGLLRRLGQAYGALGRDVTGLTRSAGRPPEPVPVTPDERHDEQRLDAALDEQEQRRVHGPERRSAAEAGGEPLDGAQQRADRDRRSVQGEGAEGDGTPEDQEDGVDAGGPALTGGQAHGGVLDRPAGSPQAESGGDPGEQVPRVAEPVVEKVPAPQQVAQHVVEIGAHVDLDLEGHAQQRGQRERLQQGLGGGGHRDVPGQQDERGDEQHVPGHPREVDAVAPPPGRSPDGGDVGLHHQVVQPGPETDPRGRAERPGGGEVHELVHAHGQREQRRVDEHGESDVVAPEEVLVPGDQAGPGGHGDQRPGHDGEPEELHRPAEDPRHLAWGQPGQVVARGVAGRVVQLLPVDGGHEADLGQGVDQLGDVEFDVVVRGDARLDGGDRQPLAEQPDRLSVQCWQLDELAELRPSDDDRLGIVVVGPDDQRVEGDPALRGDRRRGHRAAGPQAGHCGSRGKSMK
ncbi:hypothetical protein Skr01_73030 [Sphaerisporangium krabiense]|nr:hypothetical protein Skr01_73030 [Sphaerisporangium krabiense]